MYIIDGGEPMKQLTPNEALSISKLIKMETNSLVIAQAGINIISDEQLKTNAQSGIDATQARIKGLQQFVLENNIISKEE
jgi:phosphopantetheine adenylyltransferase